MPIPEWLLFVALIVAGLVWLNRMMRRLASKAREERLQRQTTDSPPAVRRPADELLDYGWGRAASALPVEHESAQAQGIRASRDAREPSTALRRPLHPAVRGLLRGSPHLHDAIVLMTVLGPCRALDPQDHRPR